MDEVELYVYLRGGSMLFGFMTEQRAVELIAAWADQTWTNSTFALQSKDGDTVTYSYVQYSQVAAIQYTI